MADDDAHNRGAFATVDGFSSLYPLTDEFHETEDVSNDPNVQHYHNKNECVVFCTFFVHSSCKDDCFFFTFLSFKN